MINILLGIILFIILIILLFLLTPFRLSLNLNKKGKDFKGNFKLIIWRFALFTREIPTKEPKKEKKEEKEPEEKKERDLDQIKKILKSFLDASEDFKRILKTILREISIEKLSLEALIGLESPADTAMLTGYIWAFTESTKYLIPVQIKVSPDFNHQVLDVEVNLIIKIRLFWITIEFLRALTKKPVRSLINEMRSL